MLPYRDLLRADPIWDEVALYGGYKWIEIKEDLWLNRRWEAMYLAARQNLACSRKCLTPLLSLLNAPTSSFAETTVVHRYDDILHVPLAAQDNRFRLAKALSSVNVLSVIGYSPILQEILSACEIVKIYSDTTAYRNLPVIDTPVETIMSYTDRILTVIPASELSLKGHVLNWANIINI